jgi:hypothetical protein
MLGIALGVLALLGFVWFLYKKMSAPKPTVSNPTSHGRSISPGKDESYKPQKK